MSEEKLVTQVIAELEDALYARLTASDADALAKVMSDHLVYIHS
jgi:hypothetical protein